MEPADARRINRQVVLAQLPEDRVGPEHFQLVENPQPMLQSGEALCRTLLVSLDPIHRLHMRGSSYREGLGVGDVMAGFTLSEVVDPGETDLSIGSIVSTEAGWQEYAAIPRDAAVPVRLRGPLTQHMSVLGITGLTGWFGMAKIGHPRAGETVVVSAAAGATGNVAGQIARSAGARVVGITGSAEKRKILEEYLGFTATVDHHSPTFSGDLRAACPDGIDVYHDNVGGHVLQTVLMQMNPYGRIICCGVLESYDTSTAPSGPKAVPGVLISKRLRMEGFVVLDFVDEWPAAQETMAAMIASGDLVVLDHVVPGLENAPEAFVGVLAGHNVGKWMVKVAEPSAPADGPTR